MPIPQPCNGGFRFGYSGSRPFALQLGGPFHVVVPGRTSTFRLLSGPSCDAYSSSSALFGYWRVLYASSASCQEACGRFSQTGAAWGRPGCPKRVWGSLVRVSPILAEGSIVIYCQCLIAISCNSQCHDLFFQVRSSASGAWLPCDVTTTGDPPRLAPLPGPPFAA